MKLVIANKAYSSWSMRPWLLLRVFDIAFDERVIPLDAAGSAEEISRLNPAGKVPVLLDGAITVWDSLAIIEYVAEKYPDRAIWPREPEARALARSLAAEMHSGFVALRRALPMNMRRSPHPATLATDVSHAVAVDVARIAAAWRDARCRFGADGPFLFGAFSAADAMFAPVVNRLQAYGVPVDADTRTYMETMITLPAWRDWQAGAEAEGWRLERIEAA